MVTPTTPPPLLRTSEALSLVSNHGQAWAGSSTAENGQHGAAFFRRMFKTGYEKKENEHPPWIFCINILICKHIFIYIYDYLYIYIYQWLILILVVSWTNSEIWSDSGAFLGYGFLRKQRMAILETSGWNNSDPKNKLVGGLNPSEKYESQLGWWEQPNINGKVKNGHQTTNQILTGLMIWNIFNIFYYIFICFCVK